MANDMIVHFASRGAIKLPCPTDGYILHAFKYINCSYNF